MRNARNTGDHIPALLVLDLMALSYPSWRSVVECMEFRGARAGCLATELGIHGLLHGTTYDFLNHTSSLPLNSQCIYIFFALGFWGAWLLKCVVEILPRGDALRRHVYRMDIWVASIPGDNRPCAFKNLCRVLSPQWATSPLCLHLQPMLLLFIIFPSFINDHIKSWEKYVSMFIP